MNVFISWSGEVSKAVAESLRDWLPKVLQAVKPWMSAADLEKGVRWFTDIGDQLKGTDVGIICLAKDNLEEPWIHFEAGALSKTVEKAFVCPYLFRIDPTVLKGPLVQFQATRAEKEDTRKLVHTINKGSGDRALESALLNETFDKWWPTLEKTLHGIPDSHKQGPPARTTQELLNEILLYVRQLAIETRTKETSEVMLSGPSGRTGNAPARRYWASVAEDYARRRAFGGPPASGYFDLMVPYEAYEAAVSAMRPPPEEDGRKPAIGDVEAPSEKDKETDENS